MTYKYRKAMINIPPITSPRGRDEKEDFGSIDPGPG
jgi:hypothetical protein